METSVVMDYLKTAIAKQHRTVAMNLGDDGMLTMGGHDERHRLISAELRDDGLIEMREADGNGAVFDPLYVRALCWWVKDQRPDVGTGAYA